MCATFFLKIDAHFSLLEFNKIYSVILSYLLLLITIAFSSPSAKKQTKQLGIVYFAPLYNLLPLQMMKKSNVVAHLANMLEIHEQQQKCICAYKLKFHSSFPCSILVTSSRGCC